MSWYRFLDAHEVRTDGETCACGDPAVLVAHGFDGPSPALFCGPCAHRAGVFGEAHGGPRGPEGSEVVMSRAYEARP